MTCAIILGITIYNFTAIKFIKDKPSIDLNAELTKPTIKIIMIFV